MRLLVDMNLTPRWVQELADAGHEALHWSEAGDPTASDMEICAFAREHGYVVLTNDLDFPQILAHTRQCGPSVVLLGGEQLLTWAEAFRWKRKSPSEQTIELAIAAWTFQGHVRYCAYRDYGYFVGFHFAQESVWSSDTVMPRHLTNLQALSKRGLAKRNR